MKNAQFLSNLAHTLLILPTNEVVIFPKFHDNCSKIEDFLVIAKFSASLIFFASVSIWYTADNFIIDMTLTTHGGKK